MILWIECSSVTLLLTSMSVNHSADTFNRLCTAFTESKKPPACTAQTSVRGKYAMIGRRSLFVVPSSIYRRLAVIRADSWLRSFGFYGSFCPASTSDGSKRARIVFGFKPFVQLCKKSLHLHVELVALFSQELALKILPGAMTLQNRVSHDSQFMIACRKGDVKLIQQHLTAHAGSVHDRTICTGTTPLMVTLGLPQDL